MILSTHQKVVNLINTRFLISIHKLKKRPGCPYTRDSQAASLKASLFPIFELGSNYLQ